MDRYNYYFRKRDYLSLPLDSAEGRRYMDTYDVGTNYGYAGRALIYQVCLDTLKNRYCSGRPPRVLWDTNHESMRIKDSGQGQVLTVRKGAVECFPGKIALLPGSYDVPSLLGICVGSNETAFSYDHGSVHVRRVLEDGNDDMDASGSTVARLNMPKGGRADAEPIVDRLPVRSRKSMETLANLLKAKGAVDPIAWLRPIANLSQDE